MKTFWKFASGLIFVALVAIGCSLALNGKASKSTEPHIPMGVVKKVDLVQRVTVLGAINSYKMAPIAAPYNGYIRKLFVKVGQKVKAGDPLVTIVESLNAGNDEAYPIRAPFSGVVVLVSRTEGEWVTSGDHTNPILRIDDMSRLLVTAVVSETDINKVRVNEEALLRTTSDDTKGYKAIVRSVSLASVEMKQGTGFSVVLELLEKDDKVKPGMSGVADIYTNKKTNVPALGQEFIEKDNGKYFVIREDGTRQEISVGLQTDDLIEITKGLNPGDRVRALDVMALGN